MTRCLLCLGSADVEMTFVPKPVTAAGVALCTELGMTESVVGYCGACFRRHMPHFTKMVDDSRAEAVAAPRSSGPS